VRAYWEFAGRAFARSLAYRANTALRIVGNLAAVVIQATIWRALLGHGAVAGIDVRTMVTYAILSTSVGMLLLTNMFRPLDERLRTGNIAVDLLKPLSYPLYLAADSLGGAAFQGLFTMLPTLAIAALAFGLAPPASGLHLAAFLAALALALAVSFALGYLIALLAFWFLTTMHFDWSLGAFVKVFSGAFLPLWFFPPWLAAVASWLPFRYLNFVPVAIYVGRIPADQLAGTLLLGLGWSLALLGLAGWLWNRSMRRLVVQGG
jgi:ABC-2 type transport system permease protein